MGALYLYLAAIVNSGDVVIYVRLYFGELFIDVNQRLSGGNKISEL